MENPPQFWETDPRAQKSDRHDPKKKAFLRHTHKKYILQKKWSKTAICGLSSCQYILPQPIQGHGLQLDDRYHQYQRNHLVGQSTSVAVVLFLLSLCLRPHPFVVITSLDIEAAVCRPHAAKILKQIKTSFSL